MERARQKNVQKAHDYYRGLNDNLKAEIATWPARMSSTEFVDAVRATVPLLGKGRTRKGYDWKSFRSRLVRLGFMVFDRQTLTWSNRCKPLIDNQPDPSANVD